MTVKYYDLNTKTNRCLQHNYRVTRAIIISLLHENKFFVPVTVWGFENFKIQFRTVKIQTFRDITLLRERETYRSVNRALVNPVSARFC